MEVQLFIPCFVDQLFPQTGFNTVQLLEAAGCQVRYNPAQTCCGQPAFNAGHTADAAAVCKKFLADFNGNMPVVTPSASCTGFVRNYYSKLLPAPDRFDVPDIYELSEFLVRHLGRTRFSARLEGKAVYHDSCAALRECRIKAEPRQLLAGVDGLELVELPDSETCCGFGGTFAVKYGPISAAMAEQKVEHALAAGAKYLISTDLSCLMHLQGYIDAKGYPLQTMHLADVLVNK